MTLRILATLSGFAFAALAYWITWHIGLTSAQSWTAAVTVLCTTWWVFEALPSAATAMVPLVVFPFAGVLTDKQVSAAYGDRVIMLFMGAFMMSRAVEHWGAHRRIAHAMLSRIGAASGPRILLAMMLTIMVCHFGVNNTAIALMMMPVAMAIVERDESGKLATPLLLAIAYCASIGGIATPISTAPNGIFQADYFKLVGHTIPFYQWMIVGGAASIVMMFAAWCVLAWPVRGVRTVEFHSNERWTRPQIRSLVVFGLTALVWITREVPFGGWMQWLPEASKEAIGSDSTVAVAAALAMFLLPSGERDEKGNSIPLLDWKTAVSIPWGVLILFGGGIAIAAAFESSGLSKEIGQTVNGIQNWPTFGLIGVLCLVVTFLSEFTSNTATAAILMPILGAAAKSNHMDPALLMFPATLANSLAFMMPVGTPPNAIVYGTGKVRILDMVRYGFVLNLIGVVVVTVVCWFLMPLVFGTSIRTN